MKNKMLADHRYERRPRPALNVDINRTLAMFNVPADMLAGLERLKKRYGGFIKVSDNVRIHSVLTPIQHSPDPNTRAVQKRFPYSELTSRRIFPFATCPGEPAVRSPKTLHNWRFLCRSTNSEAVVSLLCSNPCDGVSAGPLALSSKYCDRVAQFTLRGWSSSQDGCGGAVSFEAIQRYPRQNARDVRVLALSQPSNHLASIAPPHVPFFNLSHAENIRTPGTKLTVQQTDPACTGTFPCRRSPKRGNWIGHGTPILLLKPRHSTTTPRHYASCWLGQIFLCRMLWVWLADMGV